MSLTFSSIFTSNFDSSLVFAVFFRGIYYFKVSHLLSSKVVCLSLNQYIVHCGSLVNVFLQCLLKIDILWQGNRFVRKHYFLLDDSLSHYSFEVEYFEYNHVCFIVLKFRKCSFTAVLSIFPVIFSKEFIKVFISPVTTLQKNLADQQCSTVNQAYILFTF